MPLLVFSRAMTVQRDQRAAAKIPQKDSGRTTSSPRQNRKGVALAPFVPRRACSTLEGRSPGPVKAHINQILKRQSTTVTRSKAWLSIR